MCDTLKEICEFLCFLMYVEGFQPFLVLSLCFFIHFAWLIFLPFFSRNFNFYPVTSLAHSRYF